MGDPLQFAKIQDLRPGDVVTCHEFLCLPDGHKTVVEAEKDGTLFVRCSGNSDHFHPGSRIRRKQTRFKSHHALDGQLDDDGETLIGVCLRG